MPDVNPDVAWAVEDVRRRLPGYSLTLAYYTGNHRLTFATDKFRNAFGDLFREFADNLCDDVCDEPTDRLQITNWAAKDQPEAYPPSGRTVDEQGQPVPDMGAAPAEDVLGQALADWWERVKGDARAGQVHLDAHRAGDGFAILGQDRTGYPRLYVQKPEQMAVRYDAEDPDAIQVAAKVWRDGKRYRLTLYYPDHLERWATKGVGSDGGLPKADRFVPLVEADPETGDALPYAEDYTHGMPVFHFPNGTVAGYGRSVLEDVIPLQDALNKSVADMLVAMEFHAYPQRWAVGVQVERDPVTGQERDPFQAGANRVWWTGKEGGAFGQFAQADLTGFLSVQADLRAEIGRKGALPPSSVTLGGGEPTATGQVILEGRMVKRVKDRTRDWGPEWRRLGATAMRMLPQAIVCEPEDVVVEWAPPETRDEKALLEALTLKQALGVPDRQLLLEAGYDTDQVREFLDEAGSGPDDAAAVAAAMAGGRVSVPAAADVTQAAALGLPQPPVGPVVTPA